MITGKLSTEHDRISPLAEDMLRANNSIAYVASTDSKGLNGQDTRSIKLKRSGDEITSGRASKAPRESTMPTKKVMPRSTLSKSEAQPMPIQPISQAPDPHLRSELGQTLRPELHVPSIADSAAAHSSDASTTHRAPSPYRLFESELSQSQRSERVLRQFESAVNLQSPKRSRPWRAFKNNVSRNIQHDLSNHAYN